MKMHNGFSLLEMLMVVTVGLVLLEVLFEAYLAGERSLGLQATLSSIQERAESAISFLRSDIHRAGYIGCARLTNDFPLFNATEYPLSARNRIAGTERNAITVRYQAFPNADLLIPVNGGSTLIVSNQVSFSKSEIILISDCQHAEIIEIANVYHRSNVQTVIAKKPLHYRYATGAEIGLLVTNTFYIAKTDRTGRDGKPVYALYKDDLHHNKMELVDNVKQMQILYTVPQMGRYVELPAANVTDWSQVKGVSIDLLIANEKYQKTWHLYALSPGNGL